MSGRRASMLLVATVTLACGGRAVHTGVAGTGGAGAVGGSVAMDGAAGDGTSGGTGGAAGTTAGNALGAMISNACGALSQTQCSVDWCFADLLLKEKDAAVYGCEDELSAFLACTLDHPIVCTEKDAGAFKAYEFDPACAMPTETLFACLPKCTGTGGNGDCTRTCEGKVSWSATCTLSEKTLHCVCDKGPKAGATTDLYAQDCMLNSMNQALQELCL